MAELERSLDDAYWIQLFGETQDVTAADVLDLWERERAVPPVAAQQRLSQVLLVATHATDGLVGVSSAYIRRSQQLRMDLWHFRAFVATAHRNANVAAVLSLRGLEYLERRFVSGEDTRGAGITYEVESDGLKAMFPQAVWALNDKEAVACFIGENARGDRVSVRYFPGALTPLP